MQRSTDRILTTHAGSLPRPKDLEDMIWARYTGVPVDQKAFANRVAGALLDEQLRAFRIAFGQRKCGLVCPERPLKVSD